MATPEALLQVVDYRRVKLPAPMDGGALRAELHGRSARPQRRSSLHCLLTS